MTDQPPKFPPETSIDEIGLSVRARNALYKMGIRTARELSRLTGQQLLGCHGFGRGSLDEVVKLLGKDFDRQELYAPGEADIWEPIKLVANRTGLSPGHLRRLCCKRLLPERKARKQRRPGRKPEWFIHASAEFTRKPDESMFDPAEQAPAPIAANGAGTTITIMAVAGSAITITALARQTKIQIIQPKNGVSA